MNLFINKKYRMGAFTKYCLICGGPGENYYEHYDDDYDNNVYIFEENKDTEWLDKVQAICNDYITDIGEYESYGFIYVEGDSNTYHVADGGRDSFDEFIPGLLVHSICLDMTKKIIKNFNNKKFFNVLKNNANTYVLNNIDYQGIENNLGQQYHVKKGEEYLIENPNIAKIKKIDAKNNIEKDKYLIPNFLPSEIQNIIFGYLDFKTMCNISSVCYYWYKLSIDDKYWKNIIIFEYNFYEIEENKENNIKELFKTYYLDKNIRKKIKNRKRIIECINQINLIY